MIVLHIRGVGPHPQGISRVIPGTSAVTAHGGEYEYDVGLPHEAEKTDLSLLVAVSEIARC